ncbi:MAG TPA: extensin family protein [Polyangiaceae bacterium]|nr:extensin family protein [Polyangiaceae bacterium]
MTGRILAFLAAALPACATVPPLPKPTTELPLAAWEREASPGDEYGAAPSSSRDGAPALAKTVHEPVAPPPAAGFAPPPATTAASPIPGGPECLSELHSRNIPFRASAPVLGIATPVVLAGPLRGLRFYASDKRPFLADCRLLLALDEIAPELLALGVSEVRFSGAYVYKLTHPGRMSMHAYGLAADLHAFHVRGTTLEVKRDFAHARGTACSSGMPTLNLVACRMRAHGVFKELLGPDDNAAHFDHFHVGLKPLPGEVAADLPLPAPPPRRRARSSKSQHKR